MQHLALAEGALPIHLVSALFTQSKDNSLLLRCQLSRHLVGLWSSDNEDSARLMQRIFPAGLLLYLESHEQSPSRDVDRLHVRDNLQMANEAADGDKGPFKNDVTGRGREGGGLPNR